MKNPTAKFMKEQKVLHIEADGCIVNIKQNLTDKLGRDVTSIEIIPDNFAGEPKRKLIGSINNRIIKLKKKN